MGPFMIKNDRNNKSQDVSNKSEEYNFTKNNFYFQMMRMS